MSLPKTDLSHFLCQATDVVFFKLVRKPEDIEDDDLDFNPEMAHQFFGEKETIFGYKDLRINIYYTAGNLKCYMGMEYSQRIDQKIKKDVQPDDVLAIIKDKLEITPLTNLDEFTKLLEKEKLFKPFGEFLHTFSGKPESGKHTYEFYKTDYSTPGFLDYHERMQSFILWFIDAASYIDADDDKWDFFTLYEKYQEGGTPKYAFVGYSTVYKYYAHPNKYRPRISQMLVLPPFQKQGLGAELLQSIYNFYIADPLVLDITVEDPSESFVRIRDMVDCRNCLTLPSFHPSSLLKGFSEDMWNEAQSKFKINKRQARRVYEILRLKATRLSNPEEYKAYRLEVKKRLNAPYKKQEMDMKKLSKVLTPAELNLQLSAREERMKQLSKEYEVLEQEYKKVIEKL